MQKWDNRVVSMENANLRMGGKDKYKLEKYIQDSDSTEVS